MRFAHCGTPPPHGRFPASASSAPVPLTCPVGVYLAPPGLFLQSSKPCRDHQPVRGPVPQAPGPRRRHTVERARATCRVWEKGRAGPHLCALPLAAQASHPVCLALRGPHSVPASLSVGRYPVCPGCPPTSPSLAATPTLSAFPATWHALPLGSRATPVGGGGGCAARPAFRG